MNIINLILKDYRTITNSNKTQIKKAYTILGANLIHHVTPNSIITTSKEFLITLAT